MGREDSFDAIVVGAGPAGCACAYTLAKEGKSVLVIERGQTAGSKNVTGGRVYTYALELMEPGIWQEAALERRVTHEQIMILDQDRAFTIEYTDPSFNDDGERPQSFTVLRAVFDDWLAAKAEEMGAVMACGIRVDDLIEEEGKIVGVKAGEDDIYAEAVIAADGVNSFIAQKAGLLEDVKAAHLGVGVKEVIELPSEIIEQRFNLKPGEGAARMILGCTDGVHGGGFLYTNRESISIGCVCTPLEIAQSKRQIHDILQDLKMHPAIYPLLSGGETVEYSAHLVSEGGFRGVPKRLYRDGLLVIGDAAGFVVNTGYTIKGIDLAIVSGVAAGRALLSGKDPGPAYMAELENLNVLPTMRAFAGYFKVLENPRLYSSYPRAATDMMKRMFSLDGEIPPRIKNRIKEVLKENGLSMWQLLRDGIRGIRSV